MNKAIMKQHAFKCTKYLKLKINVVIINSIVKCDINWCLGPISFFHSSVSCSRLFDYWLINIITQETTDRCPAQQHCHSSHYLSKKTEELIQR